MWTDDAAFGINTIAFGSLSGGAALGGFRQIGPSLWREDSAEIGRDIFEFREKGRAGSSIHLHDTRRDVRVELDLARNIVRCTERSRPPFDLYAIQSSSSRPTGWLTNRVNLQPTATGGAVLRQVGPRQWEELDAAGNLVFQLVERLRDDWSVYLQDTARLIDIQCDMWRNKVQYRNSEGGDLALLEIASASTRANGWTAHRVSHGSQKGAVHGRFTETDPLTWVEEAADGQPIFYFAETARDDWSVYLEDAVRGVSIQLDLWRNKVLYGHGGGARSDLYDIVGASSADTGRTVSVVGVGAIGSVLTQYRQVGPTAWEEAEPGKPAVFSFHETGRDARRIRLHDRERRVDVEIDLERRKLRYREKSEALRDLYDVSGSFSGVTGHTVLQVHYRSPSDDVRGGFAQTGDKAWTEFDAGGQAIFHFDETDRDEWSVYVNDPTRNIRLQLDLWRQKVCYLGTDGAVIVLYDIVRSSAKISARLVNHVVYRAGGRGQRGALRQTGLHDWVEDTSVGIPNAFAFRETGRDEWSVYLSDASRGVTLQIDLWRNVVLYGDATTPLRPWYSIAEAERIPHLGILSADDVNWVVVGADNTESFSFRQVGPVAWAKFRPDGTRDGVGAYTETSRERWIIHLAADDAADTTLRLDLFSDRVFESVPGSAERELGNIVEARTRLNGWLINTVSCAEPGSIQTHFRQTGWTSWLEHSRREGDVTYLFDEVARDDRAITLHDPERGVTAVIDLADLEVRTLASGNTPAGAVGKIASVTRKPEVWMTARRMTSRSDLTESIEVRDGQRVSVPVFRSSLSLSPLVTHIDVTASEQVTVEIDGKPYTLDAQRPVRIRASLTHKMSVAMQADALQCPAIYVRTNLMQAGERHVLLADVNIHNRLATLKDGDLFAARGQLGLDVGLGKADIDQIQTALTNIARTAQHSYNQTPHGVHHDRALLPANMKHPHFKLDFSAGGASYTALTADEVAAHVAGAERLSPEAAQGFFGDIGNFFKKAASVVVHTVEDVAGTIVDTAKHVAHDVVETIDHVGEDLVHGDILQAGKDLIQGGEHAGGDLVKGVLGVGGELVKGATQLVVVTLDYGGKLLQFVIDHTGFVGKAIGWLLEKAGGVVGNAVRWLLSPLGWDDVLLVHDTLRDAVNTRLDWLEGYAQQVKAQSDSFFVDLAKTVSSDVEQVIHKLGADQLRTEQPDTSAHSGAIEKLEWLISKLFQYGHEANPLGSALVAGGTGGPLAPLEKLISDEIGQDGSKVMEAFGDSLKQLLAAFTDGNKAPEHLLAAVLDAGKGVALLGLDLTAKIIDLVLDLLSASVSGLKTLINTPMTIPILSDFYSSLTDGRPMTVLSITCLLIATPTTIIQKALTGTRPFATGPALALTPHSDHMRSVGNTYGSIHVLMSILGPIAAGMAAVNWAVDSLDAGVAEALEVEAASVGSFGPGTTTVRVMGLVAGIVAQVTANPIPVGEPYSMPHDAAKYDLVEAPNYWSHVIWHCQSGFLVFSTIMNVGITAGEIGHAKTTKLNLGGNILAFTIGAWGIAHIALMGVLDQADRAKRDVVHDVFSPLANAGLDDDGIIREIDAMARHHYPGNVPYARPTDPDAKKAFVAALRNYWAWSEDASAGKPIPNKGFGNVMDGLPEFGAVFAAPYVVESSEGFSLIGTAAAEFIGHLCEGATYLARTAQNELL